MVRKSGGMVFVVQINGGVFIYIFFHIHMQIRVWEHIRVPIQVHIYKSKYERTCEFESKYKRKYQRSYEFWSTYKPIYKLSYVRFLPLAHTSWFQLTVYLSRQNYAWLRTGGSLQ